MTPLETHLFLWPWIVGTAVLATTMIGAVMHSTARFEEWLRAYRRIEAMRDEK